MMAESQSQAESQEHSQEGSFSIPGKKNDIEFAERHTNREAS